MLKRGGFDEDRGTFNCMVNAQATSMGDEIEVCNCGVYVARASGKGRGVFARRRFARGEVIERTPVIVCSAADVALIDRTLIATYTYVWTAGTEAILLGYGLIYNHSYQPNAIYVRQFDAQIVDFVALRDVDEGEEVTINYGGNPDSKDAVWFDVVQ